MGLYIVMMGVQGAGKGTQAKYIAEKYGIPHISTGDMFRAMKTQDTPLAREVQDLMNKGALIPDDVTNRMVEQRLTEDDAKNGVILDGYPRSAGQAEFLDNLLKEKGEKITLVAVMELPDAIAVMRAEGRRFSPDKSRTYNVYFHPPKNCVDGVWLDDVTKEPLIQRDDDMSDAVKERIRLYHETTRPLIDYYESHGMLHHIDANASIEDVRNVLFSKIDANV